VKKGPSNAEQHVVEDAHAERGTLGVRVMVIIGPVDVQLSGLLSAELGGAPKASGVARTSRSLLSSSKTGEGWDIGGEASFLRA
jgi:hypothetical protein